MMLIKQSIISDIKSIITQSKDNAIRAIDHQRTLMYWHIGKRIFEEEQEGKERADYELISLNIFQHSYNQNLEVVFLLANYIGTGNFIAHSQLCLHCGHN
jgi:hypothetical protein